MTAGTSLLRDELLDQYKVLPVEAHPLWRAVRLGSLTKDQVLQAEVQHFLRTKRGSELRHRAATAARPGAVGEALLQTYLEECTDGNGNRSHLALVQDLLVAGGISQQSLEQAIPTPANAAAMALYEDILRRGPDLHLISAGVVEYYYSKFCKGIGDAYQRNYGMTEEQIVTYRIHEVLDQSHAERAFGALGEVEQTHGRLAIHLAVRDALVATSLHYDGMLHAATNQMSFWDGVSGK